MIPFLRKIVFWFLPLVLIIAVGLFLYSYWQEQNEDALASLAGNSEAIQTEKKALFADSYPVNKQFQDELRLLRYQGKLDPKNEIDIHRSIALTSLELNVPRAILWCLFFQESRLNHLLGIESDSGIHGLGQFSYFGFYEINNQTNQFQDDSVEKMVRLLGSDVRPISPRKKDLFHPSSYYNIPTAVVASAMYLTNRYAHIEKIVRKKRFQPSSTVLWLFSAMAYNKGTRSVLAFLNEIQRQGGRKNVQRLLTDPQYFFELASNDRIVHSSLSRIWKEPNATDFSHELKIHIQNIRSCSVSDPKKALPRKTRRAKI